MQVFLTNKLMKLPEFIKNILEKIADSGFESYVVGGCVRDLLIAEIKREIIEPKDWDITTNAKPEEILKIFPKGKYENKFGTVLVPIKDEDNKTENVVEITTYRSERGYSDRRRPDEIEFEEKLENDLARRDFTVNALAWDGKSKRVIDLFGGEKDIKKKIIRAVGEPVDRFKEDALRMMRAVRFVSQLNFTMEPKTERGIIKMAGSLKFIAKERIKDELIKILSSDNSYNGLMMLYKLKLLQYIIPELLQGENMKQNHHHIYTVFKHSILSLKFCPNKDWRVRFAALFHDVGKPKTRNFKDGAATFYNHEYAGERMTRKIMKRLKFSATDTEKVAILVRNHMFYYDVDAVTASSVRRLIKKVGKENLKDLIDMRIADRLGSGTPKAKPYKLRHLEYMFERVQNDPVSVKCLKIDGDYLIKKMGITPGPKMGALLDVLLSEVIEDPKLNNLKYLVARTVELKDNNLEELALRAKDKIEIKKNQDDKKMKKGYYVK
ncbi:CCA tRNA nucleotidyltransferase [Candidatus Parcubacteria bacterium]|nr:CCA tRNA nucleotidyltransferase [Candidatus Parcubacteria bacterium]